VHTENLTVQTGTDGALLLPGFLGTFTGRVTRATADTFVVEYANPCPANCTPAQYVRREPSPPAGPPARLALTVADTLIFSGQTVDIRALVVRAEDATGRWIADPPLSLAASPGWALEGTVLRAPDAEATGTLSLSSGAATAEIAPTAGADLRTFSWTVTWACRGATEPVPLPPQVYDPDLFLDSARYSLTGVVRYRGSDYTAVGPRPRLGNIDLAGTSVVALSDGRTVNSTPSTVWFLLRQPSDSLVLLVPDPYAIAAGVDTVVVVRASPAERRYVAAPPCGPDGLLTGSEPLTVTLTPAGS